MAEQTVQVAFRFSEELVERLDSYAKQRASELRGMRVTRADAIRVLLEEGLDRAGLPAPKAKQRR